MDPKDWIAAILATASLAVSLWVWYTSHAQQRRGMHAGSMTDYQQALFELNALFLQYPAAGRMFEAGRLAGAQKDDADPGSADVTVLSRTLYDDDLFRLRLLVLYHLDLLEVVYEYYRGHDELSDPEQVVRDSWRMWGRWQITGNKYLRHFVLSKEFADTYNPHFVALARKELV